MAAAPIVGGVVAVAPAGAATPAPDLSIAVQGPSAVGVGAPFTEIATVTNHGTAATPGITVSYSTGTRAISPGVPPAGIYCFPIQYGHSGRGGGVTTVGDSCNDTISGGLAPGKSVTLALTMTEGTAQTLTLAFSTAPYPAASQLNLVSHTASVGVTVIRPPAAAAPSGVAVTESGDQLNVQWTPAPATAPYISASVITVTPVGSTAPVLTAVVPGATTSGAVPGVVASTAYSVTVANNDAGGPGATSQPASFTTGPATIVPGAPTIAYYWGYAALRWVPTSSGNSVIDEYEVLATGGQTLTTYVSGSTLSAYLAPAPSDLLTVKVRAHNAAGWGPWSKPVQFVDGGN